MSRCIWILKAYNVLKMRLKFVREKRYLNILNSGCWLQTTIDSAAGVDLQLVEECLVK